MSETTTDEEIVIWTDRDHQPRCPNCGRFAYWCEIEGRWKLRCVVWDGYHEAWEHE